MPSVNDTTPSAGSSTSNNVVSFGPISIPAPNLKFPSAYGINLAGGDTDLYTVPAGRNALLFDVIFTDPTTAVSAFAEVKSAGVYHIFDFINLGSTGLSGQSNSVVPFLLHAGESFSVNTNNTGISVWPYIMEFDASAPIFDARLFSLNAGSNTLFTVPAGKTITFLNFGSNFNLPLIGQVYYFNKSGATRTVQINAIPNAGSASTANAVFNTTVSNNSIASSPNVPHLYGGLNPGDFINVNSDASTATQTAWVIYTTQ